MGMEGNFGTKRKRGPRVEIPTPNEFPPAPQAEKVEESVEVVESPASPEILEAISFTLVTDRNGEPIRYKSSAMGRKEVRLDPSSAAALSGLDTRKEYRVQVVSDTDPTDPLKGSYVVEIISDFDHKDAQRARAARLRTSKGFKTLAGIVNNDPDVSMAYRAVAGRHKEFHSLHTEEESRHRNFTGMLSGLMMSERGRNILDRVIDRTITAESDTLKERIKEAEIPPYVPGVTIGAGVYGAVLAATRQMYLPEVPDLTIEQNERVGGQFAQYKTDLFRLNSRRRPELPDAPHLPGSKQSLNSFGNHSVMQSSDTGSESYPYQSTIADTARVNFFLSGEALVNTEIRRISENNDPKIQGKLILELLDKDSERVIEVATDRVTFSSGLGEEADRLDPTDIETRSILAEEKKRFKEGGDASVMSFTEFARRMSDPANPFPLKGMKRLVLSGEGDSANVIAGIALGYESQIGKTSSQLDSIEEIIWVGQRFETKEEFLANIRTRYAAIGLEFPRERFENYYHRITPVTENRSERLSRTSEGNIRVSLQGFGNKNIQRDIRGNKYVEGDHFIYAHGFNDTTDDVIGTAVLQGAYNDIPDAAESIRLYPEAGESIYYKSGPIRRMSILSESFEGTNMLTIEILKLNGQYENETLPESAFRTRRDYFDVDTIERTQGSATGERVRNSYLETEFANVRGTRRPVAKSYKTRNGGEIFKVGPAAALPLGRVETLEAPALESIKENTAAIFRYIDTVEALGERTSQEDRKRGVTKPALFKDIQSNKTISLPSLVSTKEAQNQFSVTIKSGSFETLGLEEQSADMLKLAVGDSLSKYVFPSELKKLELTVVRTTVGRSATRLIILSDPPLSPEYQEVIQTLRDDRLGAGVLKKLTDNVPSHAISIRIPLHKGKVDGANVAFDMYRISEEERIALEA